MISTIIYFLPCIVAALCFFSFVLKQKGERQTLFSWILAMNVAYYTSYALYISPQTNYHTMVVMDIMSLPLIPTALAAQLVYMRMHRSHAMHLNPVQLLLLIPAFIVGTVTSLIYYLVGIDEAARLIELCDKGQPIPIEFQTQIWKVYNFFAEPFVNFCALLFMLFILTQCISIERRGGYRLGDVCRFLFCHNATTPSRAIALLSIVKFMLFIPMTCLGRRYMLTHDMVGVTLTLLIGIAEHLVCYIEFYSENFKKMTLYDLSHLRIGGRQADEVAAAEHICVAEDEKSNLSKRKTQAAEKMQKLLEEDKVYTDENMSSAIMAERLGIGHTTFSSMVVDIYGISFRELLNKYRVEHAKQYMLANPSATQEVVASECGFKNAQYLNYKFKSIVGDTPSIWVKKQKEERNTTEGKETTV